jgi:hypothetical protein
MELDFAGRRTPGGLLGIGAAVLGIALLLLVGAQAQQLSQQREGLELRRSALARSSAASKDVTPLHGLGAQDSAKTLRELATPWSQLLAELEQASADTSGNVAVLAIEPDHARHRIRVTAEARDLKLALGYVQRLKRTHVLRFPMLENHEIKRDDRDHPVRFQISADWSDVS